MGYTKSSVKRAVDTSGDDISTYLDQSGAHIQAVANVPVYDVNDVDEDGSVTYIGIENAHAEWTIKKLDETSGMSIRYATETNNTSYTDYTSAWASRVSLIYGLYSELF